ncbi:MAG: hypothetical protein CL758_01560 [Chloroflexi bacterium]|nr:hypothetical protein [Chloroflexota bacterium]
MINMYKFNSKSKIGFIGTGSVGGSLALSLHKKNYPIVALASKKYTSAEKLAKTIPNCKAYKSLNKVIEKSEVIFITTTDDCIENIVSSLVWQSNKAVIHCSGAASTDILKHASQQKASTGTFHPLQAFASIEKGVESIPGTTFAIEGDPNIISYLKDIAFKLEGSYILLKAEDKVLYHVSGVMLGGLLTSFAATTAQIWDSIGLSREEGLKSLSHMMEQVSKNLNTLGIPAAIAGPYPRGDIGTIKKHLKELYTKYPKILPLYCELALCALPLAIEKGSINKETHDEIYKIILKYKKLSS